MLKFTQTQQLRTSTKLPFAYIIKKLFCYSTIMLHVLIDVLCLKKLLIIIQSFQILVSLRDCCLKLNPIRNMIMFIYD